MTIQTTKTASKPDAAPLTATKSPRARRATSNKSAASPKNKTTTKTNRPVKPLSAQSVPNSKSDAIVALLKRKTGASIAELQDATDWQPHSVRGFLSGTVKKKLGLKLCSERSAKGERRYSITKS